MNKQFTPGPWVVIPEYENGFSIDIHSNSPHAPHYWVADVHQQFSSVGNGHANANLIAAAPEMFELLEKFCEQCNKQNIDGLVPEYEQAMALLQRITNPQH